MARSVDEISGEVVDAAYKLHTAIGPGLLESAYESLLARSLEKRGLRVERQKLVSFEFDGQKIGDGLRIDLLVENAVVVEIKAKERLLPVDTKQLVTYLRIMKLQVGLLINFDGATLREGLRRVVNGYQPAHFAELLPQPTESQKP